jgi:glycerate kinase
MRVLIAFDKFKDSLSARQACALTAEALRELGHAWELDLCPLADGGEGFAEILTLAAGGELQTFTVTGPRGEPIEAPVGLVRLDRIPPAARARLQLDAEEAQPIAVIAMASASGLEGVPRDRRDPWQATSLGTGELVRAAAGLGAGAILLGVGGSATNDLGLGALSALGFSFSGADERPIAPLVPAAWARLIRIDGQPPAALPAIRIACDVSNPLLGPRGAAAVFGPQKGLLPGDYARLEAESGRLAALLCAHCGQPIAVAELPGAGAAGGIAFGLMTAVGARLLPGSDLVSDWLDLDARLAAADLVITGEGSFDESSWGGKGPGAVVARALALGKPVRVFAGRVATDRRPPRLHLHAITPAGVPLADALRQAADHLRAAVRAALAAPSGPSPSGG